MSISSLTRLLPGTLRAVQKRAKRLALVACGFLVAIAALILVWPAREPAYAGKTLSQWVILLPQGPWPMKNNTTAEDAVAHIGPAALPYLTKWIQYREPQA